MSGNLIVSGKKVVQGIQSIPNMLYDNIWRLNL